MRHLTLLAGLVWSQVALALPASFATSAGERLYSDAAQVVVGHGSQSSTLTIAAHVRGDARRFALIVPVSGEPVALPNLLTATFVEELDRFTAPRVDDVSCNDLVDRHYLHTAPGCSSVKPGKEALSEEAMDALTLPRRFTNPDFAMEVVASEATETHAALLEWLELRAFFLPEPLPEALVTLLADPDARFIAAEVVLDAPPPDEGVWLTPIQIETPSPPLLPLSLGAEHAGDDQDVMLTVVDSRSARIVNYPQAQVESSCMVVRPSLSGHYDEQLDGVLPGDPLANWLLEYGGPATSCDLCTTAPLERFQLGAFGFDGMPTEAWLSRMRLRYRAADLLDAPVLAYDTPTETAELIYFEHNREAEFAVPLCGQETPEDAGVCPDLDLEPGCSATALPPSLAGILLVFALARRRRATALALLAALLITAQPAHAQDDEPPLPRFDVTADLTVMSTYRLRIDGVDGGAPWLAAPQYGVETRWAFFAWQKSSIGTALGVRTFGARAPGGMSFRFTEPHLGFDVRHGSFQERAVCPMMRYGLSMGVGVMNSALYTPRATVGALFHVGGGAFLGRGTRRLVLELRGSMIPRTDAYEVRFDPRTGLTGWRYLPGNLLLSLMAGAAFR
jgi:uncharacterized protein (TIGR03382 family)